MKKVTSKTELVTPEIAAAMLERNDMNRSVSTLQVERYAQAMAAGEWRENGQTITCAEDGMLLDGQHRLQAVIKSGVPIRFLIVRNVPKQAMSTIDTGSVRTLAHVLGIKGVVNPRYAASITRLLYVHDIADGEMRLGNCKESQRNALLEGFYDSNKAIIDRAAAVAGGKHHFVISHLGLCYVLFARKSPCKADEFFILLKTGENLTTGHPVLSLRTKLIDNRLQRQKFTVRETVAFYIKAWNAFVKGKTLSNFRWSSSEPLPEIR